MSTDKTFYRVVERNGETVIVDLDGKLVNPHEMKRLASHIIETIERPMYVYIGVRHSDGMYKIGKTGNVDRRAKELDIEIIHTLACKRFGDCSAVAVESHLHRLFTAMGRHETGEWFRLNLHDVSLVMSFKDAEFITDGIASMLKRVAALAEYDSVEQEYIDRLIADMFIAADWERRIIIHYLLQTLHGLSDDPVNDDLLTASRMMVAAIAQVARHIGNRAGRAKATPTPRSPMTIIKTDN